MSALGARVNAVNDAAIRPGRHVLYWMIAARRTRYNFALEHAVDQASRLGLPLMVLEALRLGYRWASPRVHRFVIDGMADTLARFDGTPIAYHAYVEPRAGEGAGLLEALATDAALVVTDEFPCFFLPRMVAAAGRRLASRGVRLETVDGNGLLPLRAPGRDFTAAQYFRRFLHRALPDHLEPDAFPTADPLAAAAELPAAALPEAVARRWPAASLPVHDSWLASLPLDHAVGVAPYRGGEREAGRRLDAFVDNKLARYAERRKHPDDDVSSGLSPWLHFGHISPHEIFERVRARERWSVQRPADKPTGRREGWWRMSPEAEAFLDELITWRELGFNFTFENPDRYDRFESLPAWALKTLEAHRNDERPWLYDRAQLEEARTHDPLWNAAQRQLMREGRIHNTLRMLWGKKILEWSPSPQDALAVLIELNNRWSTDGRDPNSYNGIAWTLGRFDRAWGPERPIFGTVRYMSSKNTARKVRLKRYLERFGPGRPGS